MRWQATQGSDGERGEGKQGEPCVVLVYCLEEFQTFPMKVQGFDPAVLPWACWNLPCTYSAHWSAKDLKTFICGVSVFMLQGTLLSGFLPSVTALTTSDTFKPVTMEIPHEFLPPLTNHWRVVFGAKPHKYGFHPLQGHFNFIK